MSVILMNAGMWVGGLTLTAICTMLFSKMMSRFFFSIKENVILRINRIDDEKLREAAKSAIRFAADRMPEAEGNKKLQFAIKFVQDVTPNIIISDERVKKIIEQEYLKLKYEFRDLK